MSRNLRVLVPLSRALKNKVGNAQPLRTFLVPERAWNPLASLDSTFQEMDRQFQRMEREMNSIFRDFPRLTTSVMQQPALYDLETSEMKPQVVETEGDAANKYLLNIYMGEKFSPENIKLSLKDRVLTIDAKVEEKGEDARFYQEVSRQFTLPEKADLNQLKSTLTPEGILRIECPIPKEALPESKPQEIAISRE